MSSYNKGKPAPRTGRSPLTATASTVARTHEGGAAFVKDAKTELFTLGCSLFAGGEGTFYESGKVRDKRFMDLVAKLAVEDREWTDGFLNWLRDEGNIRTASIMGAVTAVHARLAKGLHGDNRAFIANVPSRLDEVPELFAIWDQEFGRPFPASLKRGASDALSRLLNEYSYMKYGRSGLWTVSDVIELAHAKPGKAFQEELFKLAIAERHGNAHDLNSEVLTMIAAEKRLRADFEHDPTVLLNPDRLKAAGFTWEDALSLAGKKLPKDQLWNSLIESDSVGYMAMLRNLRNFQEAGISKAATSKVLEKLSDPNAVARSRQFPFRFFSAYLEATGSQWAHALETALEESVRNIPEYSGRNLVLIDTSSSMQAEISNNSKMSRVGAAALFGTAVALRNPGTTDMYLYASGVTPHEIRKGASILRTTNDVYNRVGEVGHGTQTVESLRATYNGHDRVFIFTDGQSFGSYYGTVPAQVPESTWLYVFDLAGYKASDIDSGNGRRHQLAGLTDKTFNFVDLVERGRNAQWPWEK